MNNNGSSGLGRSSRIFSSAGISSGGCVAALLDSVGSRVVLVCNIASNDLLILGPGNIRHGGAGDDAPHHDSLAEAGHHGLQELLHLGSLRLDGLSHLRYIANIKLFNVTCSFS